MKQKKYDLKTTILSNQEVAEGHYMLHCNCPEIAHSAEPGQFIHVLFNSGRFLAQACYFSLDPPQPLYQKKTANSSIPVF